MVLDGSVRTYLASPAANKTDDHPLCSSAKVNPHTRGCSSVFSQLSGQMSIVAIWAAKAHHFTSHSVHVGSLLIPIKYNVIVITEFKCREINDCMFYSGLNEPHVVNPFLLYALVVMS